MGKEYQVLVFCSVIFRVFAELFCKQFSYLNFFTATFKHKLQYSNIKIEYHGLCMSPFISTNVDYLKSISRVNRTFSDDVAQVLLVLSFMCYISSRSCTVFEWLDQISYNKQDWSPLFYGEILVPLVREHTTRFSLMLDYRYLSGPLS